MNNSGNKIRTFYIKAIFPNILNTLQAFIFKIKKQTLLRIQRIYLNLNENLKKRPFSGQFLKEPSKMNSKF